MNIVPFRRPNDGIPGDIATLVAEYLDHRRARGAAHNTLLAYAADLRHLQAFAVRHDISLVQLIGERLLNRWLDAGLLHLHWSRRTAARKLESVRSFMSWCKAETYLQHDPAKDIRIRFRAKRVIAPELDPLKAVVAAIGTRHAVDLRDRAMLMLLLDAALRASEVVLLDVPTATAPNPVHGVDAHAKRVYVRPKGGEEGEADVVGIEPQTVDAIKAWLDYRDGAARPGEAALFVNHHGKRLSRQGLYTVVKQRGAAAGLPSLHPHMFRHRRIGDIVEKLGLDVGSAQARHKHKSTTANVYGAHAAEVQRHAVRTMAPLGDISA
ncbi:MAG TPA: tyrosine-type recombinase/integrase [Pseudoxanthomonas sp.]|nr:tyrosine-type recombinase/integrase [Pseudoxanthomonas sp.]